MSRILKRIIKALFLIILAIAFIIVIITKFFTSEIEREVIKKIEQNLETPLILDDVSFSIYNNFPSASIKITNLLALESDSFNNDTLLFSEQAYVELSLYNIIRKKYNFQNVIITDAKINIKYNDLNFPNFLIFKKRKERKTPLSIKKITLLNTHLSINKSTTPLNLNWNLNRAIIKINNNNYNFNVAGFSNKLLVGNEDYMHSKKFDINADTEITKHKVVIYNSNLNIENIILNLHGDILNGNIVDLKIQANQQKINTIIKHLPEKIKLALSSFIAYGKITFNSSLKGLISKRENPYFNMEYQIEEGKIKLNTTPFELHNIEIGGRLNNGKNRNFTSTKIMADFFKSKTKNGYLNGKFKLTNLNNYFISSEFKSSWDLKEVNQYFKKSPFSNLKGKLFATSSYKGNIAFDSRFKKMFLDAIHQSEIKLMDVNFNYKEDSLNFILKSANFKVKEQEFMVSSSEFNISETDLKFTGNMRNIIPYILQESPKIYINGNVTSTYTNFSELMSFAKNNEHKITQKKIMPQWINATTEINIDNFSYEKFIASDLTGIISYENEKLEGVNLNGRSLNGEIFTSFTCSEPITNNLKLVSNINLEKINIRNSFEAFNNYGQEFIPKENLKGVGSAKIEIEAHWGPNLVLDKKKLKLTSHLIIEKGELIDFKPLENLSSYVSLDELKHVKFSTLENTINVENEIITIPTMEVKSSALSVFLSGTHSFNQDINYEITLLLSELLSNSFRKENTTITEFGEEKKDGETFNTVYFKMTGNTNNPKISLNKIRFMEDVKKTIKKEKAIITNIFNADQLQKEKEEQGQEIELEWDPKL